MEKLVGHARFTADKCVEVEGQKYEAKHILIATGGRPIIPDIPGEREGMPLCMWERERAACVCVRLSKCTYYFATVFMEVLSGWEVRAEYTL